MVDDVTDQSIEIHGLVKTFGPDRALDGLDLDVQPGEVHGFLGPNGAGKSTTIRVLLGLLRKDAGDVRLFGGDPWRDAAELHRRLAYVPGDVNLWPNLTGGEVIDLLGRLRGGLDERRRRGPAGAVRARPDQEGPQLLQGQPAEGRARGGARVRRGAARARRAHVGAGPAHGGGLPGTASTSSAPAGHTVLLSSHILAEVERLCDRVSIIRAGQRVETGTLAELRHLTRTSITADLGRVPAGLDGMPGVHDLRGRRAPGPARGRHHPARRRCSTRCRRAASARCSASRRRSRTCSCATTATGSRPAEEARREVTGTRAFLRAFLRRDRWLYLWWGLGVALLYVSQAWSVDGLYTDPGGVRQGGRRAWRGTPRSSP